MAFLKTSCFCERNYWNNMAQSNSETYIDTREVTCISKEETNYLRIANMLLRVSPPIVRQKIDREFYPGVLQTVLNQNRFKVLTELSKRHVINKKQWELLFPQKGDASSLTFDLNLMLVLIRHLTPIQIGDKLPVSSLTDEGADLTRLKYYRNELTHNEDGALTDSVFEKWWNDICQAIIRLGGQKYQQKCVELKERRLDGNDREILIELRNIDKTNDPIPVGMKHVNYKTVKEWEDLQDTVYETRAIQCLRKMIKENDIVTVIGCPGCGKTTAIHHVALWLHREEGYDILPIYKPSEIRQYYDPKRKQVFVFDDVCGKFSLHLEAMRDWAALSECIKKIVDENLTKILVSCRSYIFLQFTNVKLLSSSVCNFISPDNELTLVERYEIAKSYLTEDEANTLKRLNDFNKYDFFPLLCKFYARNRTGDICKIFSSPEDVIKEDLMAFMNETDQTAYGTLALFVIYNNFISKDLLSRKSKLTATLHELSQECKMTNYFSITVVEKQLDSLTRSYAKKTDNGYSIIHDKLFDILVSFYGKHMFDLIIDLCHKDILRDRYHFESVNEEHLDCLVIVAPEQEGKYLERLFQHFEEGHIDVVFENRLIKYEVYRNKIIKFLRENEKSLQRCTSTAHDTKSLVLTIATQGHSDILQTLIDLKFDVNLSDEYGTPLYRAAVCGHISCVELLLRNNADPNKYTQSFYASVQTPLYVASEKGHTNIVQLLLSSNGDPNMCDDENKSPLHIASDKGHTEIVQLLLSNNGDPNICDANNRSPLYVASKKGHTEIVRLLLSSNVDPNICDAENRSPLYVASLKGHTDIVQLLLSSHGNPNIFDKNNISPLMIASYEGHTDIVQLLLSNNGNPNICEDEENRSPLYVASFNGHTDIVQLLLSNNGNPNICDEENKSPLYIASLKGYKDIVQLLLSSNGNPNICEDKENRSPLYIASKKGHTDIVQLLLSIDGDPNICDADNRSPLYVASRKGYTEIVQLLLSKNCDPNKCNAGDRSPLYVASEKGHTDTVYLLLNYNADPNIFRRDIEHDGETPLYSACVNGHTEIVQLLLKYNANYFTITKASLYAAVKAGHRQITQLLLEHNVFDHDQCDIFNQTPLFIASWNRYDAIVELLLRYKFNPDVCNNNNLSPLFIASKRGFTKIVKLLLQHGASVGLCDRYQQSPLFIATKNQHLETIQVLLEYQSDPFLCNKHGFSPLTMSICNPYRGANKDIFTLLLTHCMKIQIIKEYEYSILVTALKGECEKLGNMLHKQTYSNISISGYISPLFVVTCLNNALIVEMLLENRESLGKSDKHQTDDRIMQSSFLAACVYGFEDIVRLLLKFGHDPNKFSETAISPLCIATKYGHLSVVKLLIEGGCDSNIIDSEKKSPLFISAWCDYSDIAQYLLEQKCNVDFCFTDNSSSLYISSLLNHVNIVKLLLAYKCNTDLANINNETPLFVASQMNHLEIVKLLLENESDPNICNKHKETPLHIALKFYNKDIVRILLENKCDPNICDKNGDSPICILMEQYSLDKHRVHSYTRSFELLRDEHYEVLELLQLLLKYNSNPNMCNKYKNTPLLLTISDFCFRDDVILELLLKHNCDPNLSDSDNKSPLYVGAANGNSSVVQLLLKHQADPDICDSQLKSPLHVASENGHTETVKLLLNHKCNLDLCDVNDETPLFLAAKHGHLEIVKLLIEHNCNPYQFNKENESPWNAAMQWGNTAIADLLLQYSSVFEYLWT